MSEINSEIVKELFEEQFASWEQASNNYKALDGVLAKEIQVDGFPFKVQFNPARIVSSAAKVDAKSIQERKCFLCKENRPVVQKGIDFLYKGKDHYTVLINPFPIFSRHLTIPMECHQDQLIKGRFDAMLELARQLTDYTIFYNGPKCGASAPDHFHFQAGIKGFMPIESASLKMKVFYHSPKTTLSQLTSVMNGVIVMETTSIEDAAQIFDKIYSSLKVKQGESEPMLNILCWYDNGSWAVIIYLRSKHRPECFFKEGEENILISPASVDLGGVFITPLEKDFAKITAGDISSILSEILISSEEFESTIEKIKSIL